MALAPEMGDLQSVLMPSAATRSSRAAGIYSGPLRVARRITLSRAAGAVVAGSGKGSVITVSARGAVVRGL